MFLFFFFSSRRRHTRCSRDWSSDVCSSDLLVQEERETVRVNLRPACRQLRPVFLMGEVFALVAGRSEEHTSELQSRLHLVCRLLLEKKKKNKNTPDRRPQPTTRHCTLLPQC